MNLPIFTLRLVTPSCALSLQGFRIPLHLKLAAHPVPTCRAVNHTSIRAQNDFITMERFVARARSHVKVRSGVGYCSTLTPQCFPFVSGFHLPADHVVVRAACSHKFFVSAAFDNAAVFHEKDHVGAADGGETMCDDEGGASGEESGHG